MKFVIESRQFPQVSRVPQLSDQISRSQHSSQAGRVLMEFVIRNWKPSHFNVVRDSIDIDVDQLGAAEPFSDEKLAAIHMMRCQHHIRTRRFDLNRATIDTRSNDIVVVLLADSSDISDIVTPCGQRKVQPVSGRFSEALLESMTMSACSPQN